MNNQLRKKSRKNTWEVPTTTSITTIYPVGLKQFTANEKNVWEEEQTQDLKNPKQGLKQSNVRGKFSFS